MLGYEDLSEPERKLWEAIPTGTAVDLRVGDPERDDPADGASWGTEREIRAQLLLELLTTEERAVGRRPRALRVAGARITGELNLEALTLACPMAFAHCLFDAPVLLDEASAPRVEFVGSHLPALAGRQLETRGDVNLREVTVPGEVRLLGAHIGGELDLSGAHLTNPGGFALNADGLQVDRAVVGREGMAAQGEVRLLGAHVGGPLDLSKARLTNPGGFALNADGLQVDQSMFCRDSLAAVGEVRLLGAHIGGQLDFSTAQLINPGGYALNADALLVDQAMFCREGFAAYGEVRLIGAHIAGPLDLSGAQLTSPDGCALNADGLQVDLGVFCEGFGAHGEVRLIGAHIGGGALDLSAAQLTNPDGQALVADRLQVDQGMFCVGGFSAEGALRLLGAHIGGQLVLSGAQLTNPDGHALNADRLQVDHDMFCQEGFTAKGEVRLLAAHIAGQLDLSAARLINPAGLALNLENADAAVLKLPAGQTPEGIVDLTDARVGQLHDVWRPTGSPEGEPVRYRPRLAGFVFESLGPGSDDCAARLDWLAHAEEGYLPHAYDQLGSVYRRAGQDEDVRRVAIAKQRRRRSDLPAPVKALSYVLDATVGYGYRTWRAVYALLAIMVIGWGVFSWASWEHLREIRPDGQRPPFQPWLYSIDAVLPVVNLGQESAWAATGAAQVWFAISVLAGWLLSLALISVLTATLFRE